MDLKKGITFRHHHISFALVFVVLLLVVLVLMIKPALTGYTISKELEGLGTSASEVLRKIDLVKSEKIVVETNLDNCKKTNEDYLGQVTDEKSLTFNCLEEKKKLQFDFNALSSVNEQKKSAAELEVEQLKISVATLESSYDSLAANSADNICCKNKIDNSEINSYMLSGNSIVCTVGGENRISC